DHARELGLRGRPPQGIRRSAGRHDPERGLRHRGLCHRRCSALSAAAITTWSGLCGSFARALAGDCTVVTYDPRGIGNSRPADTPDAVTPTLQAADLHCLLSALGGEPATCSAAAPEPSSGSRWSPPIPPGCARWSPTSLRWSSCCPTALRGAPSSPTSMTSTG